MGQCLERGLNTMNLPWSDNSSGWAMGLTKRRDYNGRIKKLRPDLVIPAKDGGADIVTRKLALHGSDANFKIHDGTGENYSVENYMDPPSPNHLHYYVWQWYAQIAGGSDEVIRHAIAGERDNDITVIGKGFTGAERYRLSSFNRTRTSFMVLIYASGASGSNGARVDIPASIMAGEMYNNDHSKLDFRGEGFQEGQRYRVVATTNDISTQDGSYVRRRLFEINNLKVKDNLLSVTLPKINKFTCVEFLPAK